MSTQITVNGEARTLHPGQTVATLLRAMELDPQRVAVELDRRIVKQTEWDRTELSPGSVLEIVQFVGGG